MEQQNDSHSHAIHRPAKRKKTKKVIQNLLGNRGISHRTMKHFDESNSNLYQEASFSDENSTSRIRNEEKTQTKSQKMSFMLRKEIEMNQFFEIEDGRITRIIFDKRKIVDLACTIFYIKGLILAIIAYDVSFVSGGNHTNTNITLNDVESNFVKMLLLGLTTATTIFLVPLICIRYYLILKYKKVRTEIRYDVKIYDYPHGLALLIELLLAVIHPSPILVDYTFDNRNDVTGYVTTYGFNDILSLLMLVRVFAILRFFITNSHYYSNSAKRLCNLYGCDNNYGYVFKCLMNKYPVQIIIGTMLTTIFIFGYALKICERPLVESIKKYDPDSLSFNTDISNYYNAMWCMVVTMTTIGYGDFAPKTMPGRMLGFFICIYGVVIVSLMVLTLQNILTLSFKEKRVMQNSERVYFLKQKRMYAARVINQVARFNYMMNHHENFEEEAVKKVIKMIKFNLTKFKSAQRDMDMHFNKLSFEEELNRQFFFLKDQLQSTQEKVFILAELQNLLHDCIEKLTKEPNLESSFENNITELKKIIEINSKSSFNESIDSFSNIKNTPIINKNKKNPLFTSFMREKRLSDYKQNTVKFKSPASSNKKDPDLKQKNIKAFINTRKSMIAI